MIRCDSLRPGRGASLVERSAKFVLWLTHLLTRGGIFAPRLVAGLSLTLAILTGCCTGGSSGRSRNEPTGYFQATADPRREVTVDDILFVQHREAASVLEKRIAYGFENSLDARGVRIARSPESATLVAFIEVGSRRESAQVTEPRTNQRFVQFSDGSWGTESESTSEEVELTWEFVDVWVFVYDVKTEAAIWEGRVSVESRHFSGCPDVWAYDLANRFPGNRHEHKRLRYKCEPLP